MFKTGLGSRVQTNLQTPTAVVGLRGTAGTLSLGVDGKPYLQFTEGGDSYTLGDFISGVAKDVPPELADLNPAQRAAFVASAAADQAKNAAEAAKEGKISDPQAALASAKAAEAAAMEAKTAAQAMLNNPSAEIAQQAQAAIDAANKAIEAAKEAQKEAIEKGATPSGPETYTPTMEKDTVEAGTIGFDVEPPSTVVEVTISTTLSTTSTSTTSNPPPTTTTPVTTTLPTPTTTIANMLTPPTPGVLGEGSSVSMSGFVNTETNEELLYVSGSYTPPLSSPGGGAVSGSMPDGTLFEGFLGGVAGSWSGLFTSIFVSPSGDAGFLDSTLAGTAVDGQLTASGPLRRQSVGTTTLTPGNLYYAMHYDPEDPEHLALYDPAGYLLMSKPVPKLDSIFVGSTGPSILGTPGMPDEIQGITLADGRLIGIWNYQTDGVYENPNHQSWSGKWGYAEEGYAYMLGDLALTDNEAGHIGISGTLNYLDPMHVGVIGVGYAGSYSPDPYGGAYGEGIGAGTYTMTPLAFSGLSYWSHFYQRDQVGIYATGSLPGIFGGVQPLLQGTPSFAAMGEYENPDGAQLFLQEFAGTSGADSLFLFSAGRIQDGSVQDTRLRGISYGTGGIYHLSGSMAVSHYEGPGMWEATGSIQSFANLTGDEVNGRIGGGTLNSDTNITISKTTREILSPLDDPNWGLLLRSYEGTYQNFPTGIWWAKFGWSTPEPGYYLGDISADAWGTSSFYAFLSNILYMSPQYKVHAAVSMVGAYGENGWKGVGSGNWEREPLTFSSVLDYYALRMAPGVFYESEFRRPVSGGHDSYEYEYFLPQSGPLMFGYKSFDPFYDRSQEEIYLPGGYYFAGSDWPPYRFSTRFAQWTVGSLSPGDFTTLPSGGGWTRNWYEEYEGYMMRGAGSISGILGGTENLWAATAYSPASMILLGGYVPNDGNYTVPSVFRFNADSSSTTIGAYRGDVIGRINDQDVEGLFYAVYVDPNRNAGILSGGFSGTGTVYPEIGMWEAWGSLYPTQMASSVGFDPSSLNENMAAGVMYGWLNGRFDAADSYIEGDGAGVIRSIKGQDWGTYRSGFTIDNWIQNPTTTWTARAGGMGEFGTHPRLGQTAPIHDIGWWLSDTISGWAFNDKLDAYYSGKYLTYRQYGTLSGEVKGTYDATNSTWQGFSAGAWEKQQNLTFASFVTNGDIKTEFKGYDGGRASDDGSFYGYTFYDGLNSGTSHEYDAYTNTTIHREYRANGWTEQWADYNGEPGYSESYWSGNLMDTLRYGSTLFDDYESIWESGPNYRLEDSGWIGGIIGGLEDPWLATAADPADMVIIGDYDFDKRWVTRSVFGFRFYSYNPYLSNINQQSHTVWNQSDNENPYGAFHGYAGGVIWPVDPDTDNVQGRIRALYVDHEGNAGILKGDFSGIGYREAEIWEADGGLYPVRLISNSGLTVADFRPGALINESSEQGNNLDRHGAFLASPFEHYGDINLKSYSTQISRIKTIDTFYDEATEQYYDQYVSVRSSIYGGAYSATPWSGWDDSDVTRSTGLTNYWYVPTSRSDGITHSQGLLLGVPDTGGTWANGNITGKGHGSWVHWSEAVTGVFGADVKGTFDPNNMTWQMHTLYNSIDTRTFLSLAETEAGRASLNQLNIPCINIGKTTLSGSNSGLSVSMNDVTFFSYSSGGMPRIWATNNVNGSFSSAPSIGLTVPMSGGGLNADFRVNNWANSKWGADVLNGVGTLNRTDVPGATVNLKFGGNAAGTYTGTSSGTLAGTASGTAKSTP
jgi:hypothetical protein